MARFTIYHNPKCSKSRGSLEILNKANADIKIIEYLKTPPSAKELDNLLTMLKLSPEQIVRKGEDRYKELGLSKKPPKNRNEWLRVLVNNPILIERPIVTNGKKAVLGRPPENVEDLF
ncbi:MAG: arsenate reductase (glutaredoxin) [Bacteriovoracia bacterium]